jgi:hypothetical protein
MLGSYPIATRPLATLASALNVVAADATVTATATASFDSQTVSVVLSDSVSTCTLSPSFDSQTVSVVESDSASTLVLSPSFDSQTLSIIESDLSLGAALSTSWDGVGRLMSSADASVVLALSPSFDSAFSTVIGSVWSVIINPQIGPVINPVTIAAPGSGYNIGNQLRINGGDNNAVVSVTARTGTGVLIVAIVNAGTNYTPGTYTTTALTGTGSGCQVTIVVNSEFALFRSGATKGSVLAAPQTAATAWTSLSFAAATSFTTAAVTADMVSGATAGSVASTADSAVADWQGLAIGPVLTDFNTVLAANVSWSGEAIRRLIVAQLRGAASTPVSLRGLPTVIHLRGD